MAADRLRIDGDGTVRVCGPLTFDTVEEMRAAARARVGPECWREASLVECRVGFVTGRSGEGYRVPRSSKAGDRRSRISPSGVTVRKSAAIPSRSASAAPSSGPSA